MERSSRLTVTAATFFFCAAASGYVINNWWPDGDDIVMDEVFLPSATWSNPAQFQMSEWNEVDTTDNSHAFRINLDPQFSFGANDGDNTIGFLGEAGLNSEYGLSYANALAWAVCRTPLFGSRYDECDVMLDPTLAWSLQPDDNNWFQSTVLHELGHVKGLGHYNNFLSMQNSGTSKYLRNEILYMDDKEGVRQNASHVTERDLVMYHKWHDGSFPRWMSMSPTTLREGQTINLNNITVENRGTLAFGSTVRFGVYFSSNTIISTSDQRLNTGTFSSFGRFTFSTFNWSAQIPPVNDCVTRYIGGIIDDNNAWSERFESNNDIVFTDGVPYTGSTFTPTSLSILLAQDSFEQNDTFGTAKPISLPFFGNDLSIDEDSENDYFRFTVAQGGVVDIDLLFSHSLGDVDLYLLNSAGSTLASSVSVTNNESIQGSISAGTYYIRVVGFGGGSCNRYTMDVDFFAEPTVTTGGPSSVGHSGATLNATVNPNGSSTIVYFDYGTTTSYGSQTTTTSAGSGTGPVPVNRSVSSLQCDTLYHFRAVAQNGGGTVPGGDQTFTTTDELTLQNDMVTGSVTYEACRSMIVGPGFQVLAPGSVIFRAGESVSFRNGFSVGAGAQISVMIDPSLL